MSLSAFAPAGYNTVSVLAEAQTYELPSGGGPTLLVTVMGPGSIVCLLGTSSDMTAVTPQTGIVVNAGQSLPLTIGENTYISMMTVGGAINSVLN